MPALGNHLSLIFSFEKHIRILKGFNLNNRGWNPWYMYKIIRTPNGVQYQTSIYWTPFGVRIHVLSFPRVSPAVIYIQVLRTCKTERFKIILYQIHANLIAGYKDSHFLKDKYPVHNYWIIVLKRAFYYQYLANEYKWDIFFINYWNMCYKIISVNFPLFSTLIISYSKYSKFLL